jgi:hypothetical protein
MADAPGRAELIARYKTELRGWIDRRPSGLRRQLALTLGKNQSFISQITNPVYSVPIPAGDLPTIFEVCRPSSAERQRFLALYQAAHPKSGRLANGRDAARGATGPEEIRIALPSFRDPATRREVESLIRDFALRTIRLAQRADAALEQQRDRES